MKGDIVRVRNQDKYTLGDVVQTLQFDKFNSRFSKQDGVEYTPEIVVNRMADGTPLSVRVIIIETLGGDVLTHTNSWHLTKIDLIDVVDAVRLVYPEYKVPEELKRG